MRKGETSEALAEVAEVVDNSEISVSGAVTIVDLPMGYQRKILA